MKKRFWILIIVCALIVIGAGLIYILSNNQNVEEFNVVQEDQENGYMDVSALEAKTLIEASPDLIIIDVSPHYSEGHLPGAMNYYPLETLENVIPTLDKKAMYLVYCHIDSASRTGAQILIDAGFENVYRLESHFSGWKEEDYEIEIT